MKTKGLRTCPKIDTKRNFRAGGPVLCRAVFQNCPPSARLRRTGRIADFQVGSTAGHPAGLETCGTADLEVRATATASNPIACRPGPLTGRLFKRVFAFILLFPFILSIPLQAQIQQAWVARYNNGITNGTNQAVKMALDSAGNIYVTGFSQNANSNLGYVTIKYAPNGNQLWASRYDSTNCPNASPSGIVLDRSNNVIVTGSALTVEYDSNGNQLWIAPYAGKALAVDAGGNVYVTGYSTNFNTVKLNASGSNVWFASYVDYGPTLSQVICLDSNTNVYVAGSDDYAHSSGMGYFIQLAIIKYDSNGTQLWKALNDQSLTMGISAVQVGGVALDNANNLYIVADFNPEVVKFVTLMYSSNGALDWTCYLTSDFASQSHGLAVESNRHVLVTGQLNYAYNPSLGTHSYCYGTFDVNANGNPAWTNDFPQLPFGSSAANAITIDRADNIYVTGYSPGTNSGNDIVTIKYDQNGNQIWLQRYNGPGNGNDAGNAIAVDNNGNVYVTGYETTAAGGTEMVTIKYSPVALQRRADGTVLLKAQGAPGESFDVQASSNLQSWQDLGQWAADSNGLFQFDDTNAPQYNARFYVTKPQ